jgi:hypothetical protein
MRFRSHRIGVAAFLAVFFLCASFSYALDLSIEPINAQRAVGGTFRVNIYATNAVNLISYGIKLTFNPAVLQVESAQKYFNSSTLEGWLMDADGSGATTGDQYSTPTPEINNSTGTVTMIGGRLTGASTTGLSGDKVLLGHIIFNPIANGKTNLALSVAKPAPYDNFVGLGGTPPPVYDGDIAPVNAPVNKGVICIRTNPCEGDMNGEGNVNLIDVGILKQDFARDCSVPGPGCLGDLNFDGYVNLIDVGILKADFARSDCSCPY